MSDVSSEYLVNDVPTPESFCDSIPTLPILQEPMQAERTLTDLVPAQSATFAYYEHTYEFVSQHRPREVSTCSGDQNFVAITIRDSWDAKEYTQAIISNFRKLLVDRRSSSCMSSNETEARDPSIYTTQRMPKGDERCEQLSMLWDDEWHGCRIMIGSWD